MKGVVEKVVTLPFEGVEHSILNGAHVITFRGNYRLSIDQIFALFKEKSVRVGSLEYLARGISNWNCHKWAFGMRINTPMRPSHLATASGGFNSLFLKSSVALRRRNAMEGFECPFMGCKQPRLHAGRLA